MYNRDILEDELGWYALHIVVGSEESVIKSIRHNADLIGISDSFVDFYIPKTESTILKNGQKSILERKIGCYIFVRMKMNVKTFKLISDVNGFIRFLSVTRGKSLVPKKVSDSEIDKMKLNITQINESTNKNNVFEIGDTVSITRGSFASFTGTIIAIFNDEKMVSIKVNIFGRSLEIKINMNEIEKKVKSS